MAFCTISVAISIILHATKCRIVNGYAFPNFYHDRTHKSALFSTKNSKSIDLVPLLDNQAKIGDWLDSITVVERSTPHWLERNNIASISPSKIAQKQLEELFASEAALAPQLFPDLQSQEQFDDEWKNCLFSSFEGDTLEEILTKGQSNTHPLRLQLVAVPKNSDFSLHAHAAVEMAVPLIGSLKERRILEEFIPSDVLQRSREQLIGTPKSTFSIKPTKDELKIIADNLAEKVFFEQDSDFDIREFHQGQPLVNEVGSIHQSCTGSECGCLLFSLAASIHVHFLPGHFKQVKQ